MTRKIAATLFLLLSLSMGAPCETSVETTADLHVKKFVAPAYPVAAKDARMQGTTTAEIQI